MPLQDVIMLVLLVLLCGLVVYGWSRRVKAAIDPGVVRDEVERLEARVKAELVTARQEGADAARGLRQEVASAVQEMGRTLQGLVTGLGEGQQRQFKEFSDRLDTLRASLDVRLEAMRHAVGEQLDKVREESAAKLEEMRRTVDEKLHDTLEKRLGESFRQVSERLEQVHKGLGEMQSLATGVGDLKKVLTNVKVRGTWGEIQLGVLLEEILVKAQYEAQFPVPPRRKEIVDFAIRLPGREEGEGEVFLPLDAKFPKVDYERVIEASERGDAEGVEAAVKQLEARVRQEARDIRDKYIVPPHTTDFAIMYLPIEGLYAEVLRRPGLVEFLQKDCRVSVAGPTTLAALLNALQMGFRTLAIQKRSSEVWKVLAAVKKQFATFGEVFDKAQRKLREADEELNRVKERTDLLGRRLRSVEELPEAAAEAEPVPDSAGAEPS